jgi:hypothetical protein
MAYFISTLQRLSDGQIRFGEAKKIRLSGSDGIIARHVCSLPPESGGTQGEVLWDLPVAEVASGLGVEGGALFWDDGFSAPSLVTRICGASKTDETELLVHHELLELGESGYVSTGKRTGEALRLTGGWKTPMARWAWSPSKMGIGSATVGG